jgi:hypothetical protein
MTTAPAPSILCRIGIANGQAFIESPRTGNRVTFTREILASQPRVWGRIVKAAACGIGSVLFTPDELRAAKSFSDAQAVEKARTIEYRCCLGPICGKNRAQFITHDGGMYVIGDIELPMLPASILARLEGEDSHQAKFTPDENTLLLKAALAWQKRTKWEPRATCAGWRSKARIRRF